jgi:hypothetical protein
MSSSDHISTLRLRACKNTLNGRTAGNHTILREVNAVIRAVEIDSLGAAIPDNWFGIPVVKTCWGCATIAGVSTLAVESSLRGHSRAYEKAVRYFVPKSEKCGLCRSDT